MAPDEAEQLSPDICDSKVILFLGAGASAPLGLSLMGTFMDRLEESMPPGLSSVLKQVYADADTSRDLEILLERLEDYDKFEAFTKNDPNWSGLVHRGKVDNLMGQVRDIRKRAENLVVTHYAGVEHDSVASLHGQFIPLLLESNTPGHLPIFTTNYDTAIEDLVDARSSDFSLVDGFTEGNQRYWLPTVFDHYRAQSNARRTLLLFKLHGSSTWRLNKKTDQVTKECISEPMSDASDYENALVRPTQTKTIKEGPYETNYRYLRECLSHAELCVVIGFSFRDEVVRRHFAEALAENGRLSVALIAPSAERIISNTLRPPTSVKVKVLQSKVRTITGQVVWALPTRFDTNELPQIVSALSKLDIPWESASLARLTSRLEASSSSDSDGRGGGSHEAA